MRLLVSVMLEKREGACVLFVQKTPDMFTNLPSARKTLLETKGVLFNIFGQAGKDFLLTWAESVKSRAEHRGSTRKLSLRKWFCRKLEIESKTRNGRK